MVKPVILIGYGGHGYVAADILLESGMLLEGYCDTEEKKLNPFLLSYKGKEDVFFFDKNRCIDHTAFIAIGNSGLRKKIFEFFSSLVPPVDFENQFLKLPKFHQIINFFEFSQLGVIFTGLFSRDMQKTV